MKNLHLEDVINDLGGCGRYQMGLSCIIHYMKLILCFSMLHMVYGAATPHWWCVDGRDMNGTYASLTTNSSGYKSCTISNNSDPCTSFVFDKDSMSTVVTEWSLVCGNRWKTSTITSLQMFGVLVGNVACGQVADLIGRKHPLFMSILALVILNIVAGFSTSWIMFAVVRFFIGLAMGFVATVLYNVAAEYTLARWRAWVVAVPSWAAASAIFAFVSWAVKDWKYLHFITAATGIPALLTYWFVPESFRWQVVHNRIEHAERSVKQVAKINRKPAPGMDFVKRLIEAEREENKRLTDRKYCLLDLVKTRKMLKTTVLLSAVWISLGLGGYGIQFAVPALTGDLYINMFLLSALAGPMQFVNIYLLNRIGRKRTDILFLVCYFIPAFVVGLAQQFLGPNKEGYWHRNCFIPVMNSMLLVLIRIVKILMSTNNIGLEGSVRDILTTVCAITALTSVNAAWSPIQTMTIEIYPTVIRNIGYGLQNTIARIGAIIGPQLVFLETKVAGILYLICGSCAILSVLAILPLRESRTADLQDTLEMDEVSSKSLTDDNIEDV